MECNIKPKIKILAITFVFQPIHFTSRNYDAKYLAFLEQPTKDYNSQWLPNVSIKKSVGLKCFPATKHFFSEHPSTKMPSGRYKPFYHYQKFWVLQLSFATEIQLHKTHATANLCSCIRQVAHDIQLHATVHMQHVYTVLIYMFIYTY